MAGLFDDLLTEPTQSGAGLFDDLLKQPDPVQGGLLASAKSAMGSVVKGAGQLAGDLPGINDDNALKRYGQSVIDANPTAIRSLSDVVDSPWTAAKEAVGNAGGSIGGMLGVRALGQGITAMSPFAGPAAPAVALMGQAVSWFWPAAIAALPSYGGIREKQILNSPDNNDDWKSKAVAAIGAGTVGAIETKFGPQNWALGAMTKEGRAALAEKFAETTLAKAIGYGAAKGALIEGGEEMVQQPVEQLASYDDPTSAKSIEETAFSGVMGALGGGILGGGFGAMNVRKPKPADILATDTVDDAIAVSQAALDTSSVDVAPPISVGETLAEKSARIRAELEPVIQKRQEQSDAADLADLVASETRDKQGMLAQIDAERQKQTEIDAAFEAKPKNDAIQRASTMDAPTLMEQRLREALAPKPVAQPEVALVQPMETPAEEPRIVVRTPDMKAMPRELAELQADIDGGEVVRTQNLNGKYAYHVIKAPSNVQDTTPVAATQAEQAPTQAPEAARVTDSTIDGVPASAGSVDVEGDGVSSGKSSPLYSDLKQSESDQSENVRQLSVDDPSIDRLESNLQQQGRSELLKQTAGDRVESLPNVTPTSLADQFPHTVNKSGNVSVMGDPATVRAAFPGAKGVAFFADGKPAGIMFGLSDSPGVLSKLTGSTNEQINGSAGKASVSAAATKEPGNSDIAARSANGGSLGNGEDMGGNVGRGATSTGNTKSNEDRVSIAKSQPEAPAAAVAPIDERLIPLSKRTKKEPKVAKKPQGGKTLRATGYDKNPLLTFLATHGLFHEKDNKKSQKSEYSPDKAIVVSGYGPIFKRTGKSPSDLVVQAIEDGYLPKDGTEAQLDNLIRRAISGEKISPMYAEGVAENIAAQSYQEHLSQQQEAAQDEDFDPFESVAELGFSLDDAVNAGYDEAADQIKLEVNALLAKAQEAGIDTEQIQLDAHYATDNESEQAYYEAARDALAKAIEAGNRDSGKDAGSEGGTGSQEGLESYTRADVLAQQEAATQAEKDKAKADQSAEDKAKSERIAKEIQSRQNASAENFTLGQSAEDSLAGQGSIFDAPAQPVQEPIKVGEKIKHTDGNTYTVVDVYGNTVDAERMVESSGGVTRKKGISINAIDAIKLRESAQEPAQAATSILDAANVTGKERIDVLKDVKQGAITPEELQAAYPAKEGKTAPILDVGEKIGGARKDTASSTGRRPPAAKEEADSRETWEKRFSIGQVAKGFDMSINGRDITGKWTITDTREKGSFGGARALGGYFDTEAQAKAALPLVAVAMKHSVATAREYDASGNLPYEIWRKVNDNKRVKVVDKQFATRNEAMQYMAEHAREILETSTTFGEADLPKPESTIRTGVERRTGDIEGKDFIEAFGMRGVEFGNWNNQTERQEVMNAAYDGLMDLADVLGVPSKAIGLNGDLALAFGARGQGLSSARAHYERNRVVMNLTKMNGAGALAHEWFHALDHYLGRQDGKASSEWRINPDGTRSLETKSAEADMASGGFRMNNSGVREELRTAYKTLIQTLFYKAEQYVEDTAKADKFVGVSRSELEKELDKLRKELSSERTWGKRNNSPASAEQLAEFDAVAAALVEGRGLETEWKYTNTNASLKARGAMIGRHTNESLEKISDIFKAVRGRSGFNADKTGVADNLRGYISRYDQRLKMLTAANNAETKTKSVPTRFAMDAKSLDQGRGGDYWTSPHEMAARAFQGYVEDMISAKDGKSPFLNHAPENAGILTPWGAKRPYPSGDERKAMNKAFDTFVQTIQTKETDKGVAMFSLGTSSTGLPHAKVSSIVNAIRSQWENSPDVVVAASMEDPSIPQAVRDEDAKQRREYESSRGLDGPEGSAVSDEKQLQIAFIDTDSNSNLGARQATLNEISNLLNIPIDHSILSATSNAVDGSATSIKSGVNSSGSNIQRLRDFLHSESFTEKSFSSLNIKTQGLVLTDVFSLGQDRKVLDSIIQLVPVDVMNILTSGKFSPQSLFNNEAVFRNRLSVVGGVTVSGQVVADTLVNAAALSSAVIVDVNNVPTLAFKHSPATDALYRNNGHKTSNMYRESSRESIGKARGFYYKGKVYLIASELQSIGDVVETLFHEALGHRGLRGNYGDGLKPILQQIAASRKKDVAAKAAQYGLDMKDENDRLMAAEEVLAEMAQTRPEIGFVTRAVSLIRAWLRKYVPGFSNLALTDNDIIAQFLIPARRFIEGRGAEKQQGDAGQLAFGRGGKARLTDTPAFNAWFGNSKVVDAQGKPLVVYHGTQEDFETFDNTKAKKRNNNIGGEKTSNDSFWFVENKRVAQRFANNARTPPGILYPGAFIKPVYLSLKNPLIVDMNLASKTAEAKEWSFPALDTGRIVHEIGFEKEKVLRGAIKSGHDGVIFKNGYDHEARSGDIYAVFDPKNIKNISEVDSNDVVGNQGGRSADDYQPGTVQLQSFDNDERAQDRLNRISDVEEEYRLPNIHQAVPKDYVPKEASQKTVTLYRGVPSSIKDAAIRPGDWVGLNKRYASEHGTGETGKSKVISMTVPADHVVWAGTDMNEWFYAPRQEEQTALSRSADDATPGARAARQILEAIEQDDDSADYALRVIPGEFTGEIKAGDELPASKQWEGGSETGDQLDGTSAVRIRNLDEKSVLESLKNLGALGKNGPNGFYFGDRVVLIKGESIGSGEDVGESIIEGAEVVGIWKKPSKGLSEIQPNESTAPDSGGAMFSRTKIIGETTRQHTPEQLRAMKNVGFQVEVPTLKERAQAIWKDAGKKLAQGIADQFAPIKDMDTKAYGLMRLAKGASGAFESLLHGGLLKLSDNVYDFDETKRGGVIDKLLIPLQGEHHDFMRWVAANRAERLMGDGKEHLFSPQDVADLKTLATGQAAFDYTIQNGIRRGMATRDRAEIYRDSLMTFNTFNKNVLDMAEQSGMIDAGSRAVWEHEFYVPFYRVADDSDGGVRGMNIKGGVVRQQAFKQLKGGKGALNADLLDNTLMNWAHLLDASAKNRAAKATIEAAERLGVAIGGNQATLAQMGSSVNNKNGVVWFMDGGMKRYSLIDNQGDGAYLMTAITALEYAGMRSPIMNAMGFMKNALTIGVTASPFFKVRNLIRDSVQVIGTSGINVNPLANVAQGWKLTNPKSDAYFRLLAGGGTIHFGTMLEGSESKRVQALVESGVDAGTILNDEHKVKAFYRKFIEPGITAYNELGNRGEAVNRASLYAQLVKQGMTHAEASLQARDLMDFSMQGSFTGIRFLSQVVPFFNARIQGMYKLGRAAKEDPARFSAVIGAAAVISLGLLAAYSDDDDWKRRADWDRNNFWWFKFGGTAFRIPKPFEIGAIATLAERGFELAFDKEMTTTAFRKQVMTLLGDNLSMNPIPQIVKPIIDVYANKDSFSGNPIESMSMERLKSEYRFNDRTSMTARGLSTAANSVTGIVGVETLSPVQIDHMLRGYFGWLGAFIVGAGDKLARPATGQTEQAAPDYWKTVTGSMVSDLRDAPSKYVSNMYEQAKVIEQAYGTWRSLVKQGDRQGAAEFAADNKELMRKYHQVEAIKRTESKLNEHIRFIERSDISADEKRTQIRRIRNQQELIAKRLAPV